jgi:hypothetical protein
LTVNISQLAPLIWILAAILIVILAIVVVRFFWRHVLKFLIQAGLVALVIIALWAVLHYFKVF